MRVSVREGASAANASVVVHVIGTPLVVHASASPLSGEAPVSVFFNGTISGGSGTYVSARWTFGDGGVGSGYPIRYTYDRAGQFLATLTVVDSLGESSNSTVSVVITPTPDASPSPTVGWPSWTEFAALAITFGAGLAAGIVVFRVWRAREAGDGPPTEAPTVEPVDPISDVSGPAGAAPVPSAVPIDTAPEELMVSADETADPAPIDTTRVSHRVIAHLALQRPIGMDEVALPPLTQKGISEATGLRQNALTNVLRRLAAAGVVSVEARHVKGARRRLKCYQLTSLGRKLAGEIRVQRSRDVRRVDRSAVQ